MSEISKVYGYIRVSTETQADKGYGLETQRSAIEEFCKSNNYKIVGIFEDKGISGTMGNDDVSKRVGLNNLLDSITDVDSVVVLNTSRLWRDDAARIFISRLIMKAEKNIISIEQPRYSLYSKDPEDFLFNAMVGILDQYDRMCINRKLSRGRDTKARKGYKPTGAAPYGYEYTSDGKKLVINEKQAEIVRRIFQMAADGISTRKIKETLLEEKVDKKRKWSHTSVAYILNNDFYIGVLTHAGEKIEGKHKPIVSKRLWTKVHRLDIENKN